MPDRAEYRIAPATEQDVRWAARLAAEVYHGLDVIPEETTVQWWRANPTGFSTFWQGDERAGNLNILPLRPEAMRRFTEGSLLEIEMRGEDIFTPAEQQHMRDLHWESIVIVPALRGGELRRLVVRSYLGLLQRICPLQQLRHVYAIAASSQGRRLLAEVGLSPVMPAEERRDGHPLYRGTLPGGG